MTNNIEAQAAAAQRKVDAIDRRIDAVRAELHRVATVDFSAFDVMTDEGFMAGCLAAHNANRDHAGFEGFERTLFQRRAAATDILYDLLARIARAEERRAAREYRKQYEANRRFCPTCGHEQYAAAA